MAHSSCKQEIVSDFQSGLRWSEYLTVGFVLKGKLQIRFTNHVREYLAHDMLFFLPFETWSVISFSDDVQLYSLQIEPDFLNNYFPDIAKVKLQRHHLNCDLTDRIYYELCSDLASILFNNIKHEMTSEMKIVASLSGFITTLVDNYGIIDNENSGTDYNTKRRIQVLEYISNHYMNKIPVSDIAAETGLHPQYFSTWFKEQFGASFVDYLNTFRINHSINELLASDKSILDIALDHGFGNHKTYAAVFRKVHGTSPREYRNSAREKMQNLSAKAEADDDESSGTFSFFRQFLMNDRSSHSDNFLKAGKSLVLDPAKLEKDSFITGRFICLSAGRAYACLRSNLQKQILEAKSGMDLKALRIRDIFSDSLYIYYEDENKQPSYNWQTLDSVFDFLLEHDIRPFPEISYMPDRLASKKQYAGYQYKPNVSKPKSMKLWKALIKNFLLHYLDRYGKDELIKWDFDFWISPDLELKYPYWYGTMEEFFDFYKETYDAFKEVDPDLRLGSANFSSISGYPWYEAFFEYCREHRMEPAYISIHLYGTERRIVSQTKDSLESVDYRQFSVSNPDYFVEQLNVLKDIATRNGFGHLPLTVSDWSISFLPRDLIRETCYIGPWICYNYVHSLGYADKLSYWSLSDIHEEAFPESTLFYGGPGVMDYNGLRKASYNTLALLSHIGNHILSKGDYYLFAKKGNKYQILIFNLIEIDEMYAMIDKSVIDKKHRYNIFRNAGNMSVNIMLYLPKGSYLIKKWEVNRNYGSAYDIWAKVGFPEKLHRDVLDYMEQASAPRVTCEVQEISRALILDETVPEHGVVLLEIEQV